MNTSALLLAVDIGLSTTKGVVVNSHGIVITESFRRHSTVTTVSGRPGLHEHDPEGLWWKEVVEVISQMVDVLAGEEKKVECVCISGVWPTFCLADGYGNPLSNAVLFDDDRSADIARSLAPELGSTLYGYEIIPRIIWFRTNLPRIWSKARKIFSTHSYIVHKLTGAYTIDAHVAMAFGNVFDTRSFQWNREILEGFNIPVEMFPAVYAPNRIAGSISQEAAKLTGVPSGTPVVVGTGDTFVSLLSSGAHSPGDAMIYYGSQGLVVRLTQNSGYLAGAQSYLHEDDGVEWLLSFPSGRQAELLVKLLSGCFLFNDVGIDFDRLDRLSAAAPGGSNGVVFAHNIEKAEQPLVSTVYYAGILGLTSHSTAGEIYRSMMEAFAFSVRRSLETKVSKGSARVFAAGGGAKSSLWRQIVTDVTDQSQIYSEYSSGAYGGAILAGDAIGVLTMNTIAERQLYQASVTQPDPQNVIEYSQHYKRYYDTLRALNIA